MYITVKLFGGYRLGRFNEAERNCPADTSVGDLLQSLNITEVRGILLVNGKPAVHTQILNDRDTLALFPLVSGG